MKRAMTNRIIAGLLAALSLIAASSRASAAVWRWGCQGQLGGQQVVFNRGALFVAESKKLFGDARRLNIDTIDKMVADETANKNEKTSYDSNNGNGFAKAMEFIRRGDEKRKVVLTEKSSHKISAPPIDLRARRRHRHLQESLSLPARGRAGARHHHAMHRISTLDPRRAAMRLTPF